MAIAPLMEYEGMPDGSCGLLERPWPRAVLQVLPSVRPTVGAADEHEDPVVVCVAPAAWTQGANAMPGRSGQGVAVRRARRQAALRRRRRLLFGAIVAGIVTLLALPLAALGGAAPSPKGAALDGTVTGATVYVVQPGDTLWSIASRFDRGGNPRPLAEAIAKETHSTTVVAGEQIDIP